MEARLYREELAAPPGPAPCMLCVHGTATSAEVWRPLAKAVGARARVLAYDRRGWHRSEAPQGHFRTTIGEGSDDAARVLTDAGVDEAVVVGSGIGAAIAIDLLVRHPGAVDGLVLVEPPLLALVGEATEALSEDARRLREALEAGGPAAGPRVYLEGELPALGPGAERLPSSLTEPARERPLSLLGELAAIPDWPLPLEAASARGKPIAIAVAAGGPDLVRRAAEELALRLAEARLWELESGDLPPHLGSPSEVAELALAEL